MSGATRHIALVAPPTPGHVNPLLALGAALARQGYRMTLVHIGDAARLIPAGVVGFAPLGGPGDRAGVLDAYMARLARPAGPVGLNRMIAATARMTSVLLDGLPDALRRIDADAVIADSAEPAGALAARRMGLPIVTSVTGLPLLRDPAVPPPFVDWRYRSGRLGRFRNAGGYAVADALMRPIKLTLARYADRWGLDRDAQAAALVQVAQCPRGLDFPRLALPASFRYGAPWRLPEASGPVPASDGRPLVFCSLGTLQGSRKELFATMTRACELAGARAVVAHGGGLSEAEVASLPGDPLVRAFWAQQSVLPRCAAAVLHGGFNTVLDALAARVPIVAVPIGFEQPATAARLAWTGAGRVLSPARLTARGLAAALTAVMHDPCYRAAAGRIASEMDGVDGAELAAQLVSDALKGRRLP